MALYQSETKFALVSHILPPSPSGQAVVLSRLLRDLNPAQYCLISTCDYSRNSERTTTCLRGVYHSLDSEPSVRLSGFMRTLQSIAAFLWDRPPNRSQSTSKNTVEAIDGSVADGRLSRSWRAHGKAMVLWLEDRLHLRRQVFQRAANIRRIVVNEGCGALVACSGDLIDLPAACIAARWANVPFYAYMFDDYATNSAPHLHRRFSQDMMHHLMRQAAGVVVPNEFLASSYRTH